VWATTTPTDVDNANGVVIDSNYIYTKNPLYFSTTTYTWPASGIAIGAETWPVRQHYRTAEHSWCFAKTVRRLNGQVVPKPSFNVTIKNNLLVGTNGIGNFRGGTVRLQRPTSSDLVTTY
jgi:hypothetical protein